MSYTCISFEVKFQDLKQCGLSYILIWIYCSICVSCQNPNLLVLLHYRIPIVRYNHLRA